MSNQVISASFLPRPATILQKSLPLGLLLGFFVVVSALAKPTRSVASEMLPSESFEIVLDIEVDSPDGTPVDGALELQFFQEQDGTSLGLGPFQVYAVGGLIDDVIPCGLDAKGMDLDEYVYVSIMNEQQGPTFSFGGHVWLDPAAGVRALFRFYPRATTQNGSVTIEKNGLVLAPPPAIGSVTVLGGGSTMSISLASGNSASKTPTVEPSAYASTHSVGLGMAHTLYSWADSESWMIWLPGQRALTFARGQQAECSTSGFGQLTIDWPEASFPGLTSGIAIPAESYSPVSTDPNTDHVLEVFMRVQGSEYRAASTVAGSPGKLCFENLAPGDYHIELWGGVTDHIGQPSFTTVHHVDAGGIVTIMAYPQ